ncbi:MAG TPA: hypothetical protein VIL09_16905 [Microvirga sp.]
MVVRLFAAVLVALSLAACVTTAPHNFGGSDFARYRIADVSVEGVEVIRSWPGEEEVFLRTNAVDPETRRRIETEPASQFPALRAHIQRALTTRFNAEFASHVAPIFTGTRPARAVVRLRTFDVPSVARRVFVDTDAKIEADIDIVDAATGEVILRYDGPYRLRRLVGGFATGLAVAFDRSDVGHSQITDYMTAYRDWLART